MVRVIMISGWRGVGKDLLGKVLRRRWGYRRYAFADTLKAHCAFLYNVPRALFDHRTKKDQPLSTLGDRTPRDLCRVEAKHLRQNDDDYFAKALVKAVQQEHAQHVVVTDWRYRNEVRVVEAAFGTDNVFKLRLNWPTEEPMPIAPPGDDEEEEHLLDDYAFDLRMLPSQYDQMAALLPERFQ